MSIPYHNDIDVVLLDKFLSGEATPEEAMAIDDWMKEPANKKQFDEIERIWHKIPGGGKHQAPQLQEAWLQLQTSLPLQRKAPLVKLLLNRYTIAASILLVAGAAFFLVKYNFQLPQQANYITLEAKSAVVRDTLPDGSTVVINRNSAVQYTGTFNKENRELQLTGESFFNVVPNKEKAFIIQAGAVKIKVVGTSFNVKQSQQPEMVEVQVQSGVVKMYTGSKEITLAKGQTGIYTKDKDEFSIKDSVNANSSSYATRHFSFYNNSLGEICRYLENAYNVKIIAENNALLQCRMTGFFDDMPVTGILDAITLTVGVRYEIRGNTIYLYGGNECD